MESEHIAISNLQYQIDRAYEITDNFVFDTRMAEKDARRLRLLVEETLGLAMQIFGAAQIHFWLDGDGKDCEVHLKTTKFLEEEQKQDLLSVSTTGENVAYKGFMGKIRSLMANPAELSSAWTLTDYREQLKQRRADDADSQEAFDDLERSIVANIADDVTVGMKDDVIEMTIRKRFA